MQSVSRRFVFTVGLGMLAGATIESSARAQPMGPGAGVPGPGPGGPRGPGSMMGGGPGVMRGGPGQMGRFGDPAAYLDGVKAELRITDAQEPAWKMYADAVSGAASQMQAVRQSMWEAMETATWEERRDMMNRAFQARQQAFQTVYDAATVLLPLLTDVQKRQAQHILPGLARHGWPRRGGR